MAFTQKQLDDLETIIATGATEGQFDGKMARYRSLDEMMRIRETIRTALGLNGSGKRYALVAYTRDSSVVTPPNSAPDPFNTNNV